MTDGMKSGAGSDPFADNSTDGDSSSEDRETLVEDSDKRDESESESDSKSDTASAPDETAERTALDSDADELSYIFQRNGVKDDRRMVQYFLREETEDIEADAQHAIEQELGTDVYLTDLREALVRVGAEHLDEVADELRDWGYRFHEADQ